MNIITNKYNPEPKDNKEQYEVSCEHCDSYLLVDEDDLTVGEYGLFKFTCPCCGKESYIDKSADLNENNITFPIHFSDPKGAVKLSNEDITKYVREVVKYLKDNPSEGYCYQATGDTMVFGFRDCSEYDNDYIDITVSRRNYNSGIEVK